MQYRSIILSPGYCRLLLLIFFSKFLKLIFHVRHLCFRFIIVTSFNFPESNAILIDLSFFTVITAGLTKQSSVISVDRSRYPLSINRFNSFATCSCRCISRPFCCTICAPFRLIFTDRYLSSLLL